MPSKRIFLDSSVWITYLEDEPGADRFERLFEESSAAFTSLLNYFEILLWYQHRKPEKVRFVAGQIKAKSRLLTVTESDVFEALRLKQVYHAFSLADALSLACSRKVGSLFVTADSDFEKVPGVVFLRPKN